MRKRSIFHTKVYRRIPHSTQILNSRNALSLWAKQVGGSSYKASKDVAKKMQIEIIGKT